MPDAKDLLTAEIMSAAKILFFQGNDLAEVARILRIESAYEALRKRVERAKWKEQREQGLPATKAIEQRPDVGNLVLASLQEQAAEYKSKVANQTLLKGVNVLERSHPETIKDVESHFRALNSVHSVAKDVFGLGKEAPTQNLLINMSFLNSDEDKSATISVKQDEAEPNEVKPD